MDRAGGRVPATGFQHIDLALARNLLSLRGSEACQPCGLVQACRPRHQAGRLAGVPGQPPVGAMEHLTWSLVLGQVGPSCHRLLSPWALALPRLSQAGIVANLCYCCSLRSQPPPLGLPGDTLMCLSSKPPGWAPMFTPENTVTKGQTQFLLAQHVCPLRESGRSLGRGNGIHSSVLPL